MENAETLHAEVIERFENASLNPEWPPLEPESLFLSPDKIYAGFKDYPRAQLLNLDLKSAKHVTDFDTVAPAKFNINPRSENPYSEFISHLDSSAQRTLIVAESAGRRESLAGLLNTHKRAFETVETWEDFNNSDATVCLTVTEVDRGLHLPTAKIEIVTESQLYGERTFQRRRRSDKNRDPDAIIKSLAELNIGDPVVHEDHGVGRYRGLETLNVDGSDNEFATLEYRGGDKIYIPVLSLGKVSRYVGGGPDTAPLHKMGSDTWVKLPADHLYDAFAAGFGFDETPDQDQVINDVISDMTAAKPMDRLVCGDVGFGKTEIAARAHYFARSATLQ